MKRITIFTPTYNRAYILGKLYDSLCHQTSLDFEWLIVDDGSEDNTTALIDQWQGEEKITLRYFRQPNGGKMRAHNRGVRETQTELFMCVDSDDYIVEDAVEQILAFWQKHSREGKAGMVAYRGETPEKTLQNGQFPNVSTSTLKDLYKRGFRGDSSLIFRTEVLREFLFPEIDGEKFISEAYVYNQIDERYQLLVFRKIIIICDYLTDGLTRNQAPLRRANPKGFALCCDQKARYAERRKERWTQTINYVSYALLGKKKDIVLQSCTPWRTVVCFPLGILLYIKRKYKNRQS